MEEAHTELWQRVRVLEDFKLKAAQRQSDVDACRKQISILRERQLAETEKANRLELSIKATKEELTEARDKVQQLLTAKNGLEREVEVLQQNIDRAMGGESLDSITNPQVLEELARLKHENATLQAAGVKDKELQAMLDDAGRREAQLRTLSSDREGRIRELESLLEETKKSNLAESTETEEQLTLAKLSLTHAQDQVVRDDFRLWCWTFSTEVVVMSWSYWSV